MAHSRRGMLSATNTLDDWKKEIKDLIRKEEAMDGKKKGLYIYFGIRAVSPNFSPPVAID